jgi:glycosyltransferase involved in cell wall biosynthesis
LASWSDVVDVEYGQLLPLLPLLRRCGPTSPVVSTEHDVVAQTFARRAEAAHGVARLALSIQRRRVGRREIRYLNACDMVRVTSSKDEKLLRSMGLTAECLVTDFVGGGAPTRDFDLGRDGVVAFTGALWRLENSQSVQWFVNQVWPQVVARVPTAEFLAVGAQPGPELMALNARPGVTVRPWVPDLDEIYASAGVFVAPLVLGAGVKLKVLDAMRFGLPVVATTIGAEGIDDMAPPGAIAAVTNDPNAFAESVARLLNSPDRRLAAGKLASEWMAGRPSFADSVAASLTAYRDLVDRRRTA